MSDEVHVRAVEVTKAFPGTRKMDEVRVLDGISLGIRPGEMVAIVGPSGSGKSTLLYCLSGLEQVTGGSVSLFGRDPRTTRAEDLARMCQQQVGFVFQSYNLVPSLTARENIALPLRLAGRKVDPASIDAALASVGLRDRGGNLPGELSGGQQQRVAVARALATRPQLLFADEPTGALDSRTGADVLALLREMAAGTRSVVLVTHSAEAAAVADRVLVLRDGTIHAELIRPTADEVSTAIAAARPAHVRDAR
ncbi:MULTISPECIES: ABC transporter ATP-binding protein [Clavibacter]|uniref:ABC transporter ATP-binding protein n=2 Tax=Clavibacter TaxID=1573 RepID=A0A399NRB8_9MICO|nr:MULTISPECIES: ABC transporter ATP-binding protein [Clavibacter]KDP91106.1 ABC transporter ATP-binding protein [Clavibacter cf. michiganensis LMG 26808]RII96720.1 ABC transporter ATP-binding protein [Clavibacter michiganensis]UKF25695.1 ABC transporter ATP-binding protein [Clavibacter sp. A6099]